MYSWMRSVVCEKCYFSGEMVINVSPVLGIFGIVKKQLILYHLKEVGGNCFGALDNTISFIRNGES